MEKAEDEKLAAFESRKAALVESFRKARAAGRRVRLGKRTSNLFRRRQADDCQSLDVDGFNTVIAVDPAARTADVGGMTPYDVVVAATLHHGLMPAVVPELKSITVGGAVTGGGIESSSFRFGFVHETVVEMEILTASGEVVLCRPDNAHSDLFHGFANSYGTLGYALRLRIQLVHAGPYVHLTHDRYESPDAYFDALAATCDEERARDGDASFVDGVVFIGGKGNEVWATRGISSGRAWETCPVRVRAPDPRSSESEVGSALFGVAVERLKALLLPETSR